MAHLASQTPIETRPAAILQKSPSRLQRIAAAGGIMYFVALFAGFALDAKGDPDPAVAGLGDVARFMGEHPDRSVSRFLVALAALVFLWFVAALRSRIRRQETGDEIASSVAWGAGIVTASLMLVGNAGWLALSLPSRASDPGTRTQPRARRQRDLRALRRMPQRLGRGEQLAQRLTPRHPPRARWTPRTVLDVLRNATYTGRLPFNGDLYQAEHEAIIDERTFGRAQKLLESALSHFRRAPRMPATTS